MCCVCVSGVHSRSKPHRTNELCISGSHLAIAVFRCLTHSRVLHTLALILLSTTSSFSFSIVHIPSSHTHTHTSLCSLSHQSTFTLISSLSLSLSLLYAETKLRIHHLSFFCFIFHSMLYIWYIIYYVCVGNIYMKFWFFFLLKEKKKTLTTTFRYLPFFSVWNFRSRVPKFLRVDECACPCVLFSLSFGVPVRQEKKSWK